MTSIGRYAWKKSKFISSTKARGEQTSQAVWHCGVPRLTVAAIGSEHFFEFAEREPHGAGQTGERRARLRRANGDWALLETAPLRRPRALNSAVSDRR